MTQTTHPSKELVKSYMARRREDRTPPPAPEQVRRELGWSLIEAERQEYPADELRTM